MIALAQHWCHSKSSAVKQVYIMHVLLFCITLFVCLCTGVFLYANHSPSLASFISIPSLLARNECKDAVIYAQDESLKAYIGCGAFMIITFLATLSIMCLYHEKSLSDVRDTHESELEQMKSDYQDSKALLVGQFKAVIELTGKQNEQRIKERMMELEAQAEIMRSKSEVKKLIADRNKELKVCS